MESESGTRGLDTTDLGTSFEQRRRRTPRNRVIGILGKSTLNDKEKTTLYFIGRCIARLGHTLAFIPTKGTTDSVREGMETEGGKLLPLERDVIGTADHTLVYPDKRLLSRLSNLYPDLNAKANVLIIREDQLNEWREAVITTMKDKSIPLPE